MFNIDAIQRVYPDAVRISSEYGAFDANGNKIQLDQALVDAAAVTVAAEQAQAQAERNRSKAYATEADPLFFKAQRGEATMDEWNAKVAEIRARYPYGGES